jgi:hypothetical protein
VRHALLLLAACSSATSAPIPESKVDSPVVRTPHAPPALERIGDATVTDRIVSTRVVAAIDDAIATDRPVYARADQHVTLYAVLQTDRVVYSDAPSLSLHGKRVTALPLARGPRVELVWNRVEPAAKSYSNGDGPTFHFEPIEYRATAIAKATGGSLVPDVRPTLTPDHGNGVGTMRYQIVVHQDDRTITSPGPDARRGRGSGGLTDDVFRVSIRRDDTYLGYLTEMYGQPYVWASAGLSDATHQSERLEGADCADFVVYGARRAGSRFAYTWTGGLPEITKLLAAGTRGDDGIYRDKRGRPLPFTRKGDLILFPRHVAALVEDRGTIGVLDDQDIVVHALWDTPKEVPLADTGYADTPVELRRFR